MKPARSWGEAIVRSTIFREEETRRTSRALVRTLLGRSEREEAERRAERVEGVDAIEESREEEEEEGEEEVNRRRNSRAIEMEVKGDAEERRGGDEVVVSEEEERDDDSDSEVGG